MSGEFSCDVIHGNLIHNSNCAACNAYPLGRWRVTKPDAAIASDLAAGNTPDRYGKGTW